MKTRLVEIAVTAEHIRKGERGGCEDCPVALAINEHLAPPDLELCDWGGFQASVWGNGEVTILNGMGDRLKGCRRIPLPRAATGFIRKFDSACKVDEITFELRLPVDCLREESNLK